MEVLLLDPLVPEALAWLQERHEVSFRPELADDPAELRKSTYKTRAIVLPPHVVVSSEFLDFAPKLEIVARMQISSDNTDLNACARRTVRVLQDGHFRRLGARRYAPLFCSKPEEYLLEPRFEAALLLNERSPL